MRHGVCTILVPVHSPGHWTLAAIDLAKERFTIYDSLDEATKRRRAAKKVVEKLQHISLDSARLAPAAPDESGPGMIPGWDFIGQTVVYAEYLATPFHNAKSHV